jgi:DTW domain-containing protein YfiP
VSEIVAGLTKPKYNNLLIFPAPCREDITKLVKEFPK